MYEARGGEERSETSGEGRLADQVSNAIVGLFAEYYGRGPVKTKTYLMDDVVLTVLRDTLTTAERTLVRSGREDQVRDFRLSFQAEMADTFERTVEHIVRRRVLTYQSQIAFGPEVCFEFFLLGDEIPEDEG